MPIRGLPNGVRHTRPQAGRDHPQQVVAIDRNGWSRSIVAPGRDHPLRASRSKLAQDVVTQPLEPGACTRLTLLDH